MPSDERASPRETPPPLSTVVSTTVTGNGGQTLAASSTITVPPKRDPATCDHGGMQFGGRYSHEGGTFCSACDTNVNDVAAAPPSDARPAEAWQITTLRSALENWGRHFDRCAISSGVGGPACTCGLAKALEDSHSFAMSKEWCLAMAAKEGDKDSTIGRPPSEARGDAATHKDSLSVQHAKVVEAALAIDAKGWRDILTNMRFTLSRTGEGVVPESVIRAVDSLLHAVAAARDDADRTAIMREAADMIEFGSGDIQHDAKVAARLRTLAGAP